MARRTHGRPIGEIENVLDEHSKKPDILVTTKVTLFKIRNSSLNSTQLRAWKVEGGVKGEGGKGEGQKGEGQKKRSGYLILGCERPMMNIR